MLRFVAWLRGNGVSPGDVRHVLEHVDAVDVVGLRVQDRRPFAPVDELGSIQDLVGNQLALGGRFAQMLPEFTLEVSGVPELRDRGNLWGPDLRVPSTHTSIDPDVLAGEPFVRGTRIPTSSLESLADRGIADQRVADLYHLDVGVVSEVRLLEASLRAGRRLQSLAA